jgi:hypothetical protein
MTTDTSKHLALSLFGVCAAVNVVGGAINLATNHLEAAGFQIGLAGLVVAVSWGLQVIDRWSTAVRREAEAKASFAETLLARLRQAEGIGVQMSVERRDVEGTKH